MLSIIYSKGSQALYWIYLLRFTIKSFIGMETFLHSYEAEPRFCLNFCKDKTWSLWSYQVTSILIFFKFLWTFILYFCVMFTISIGFTVSFILLLLMQIFMLLILILSSTSLFICHLKSFIFIYSSLKKPSCYY